MPAVTPVLWKYRVNKDGLCPIYIRIADGKSTRYRSLRVSVSPGNWNEGAGRVNGRHPNAPDINKLISSEVKRIEDEVYRRAAEGERVDAEAVVDSLSVRQVVNREGDGNFFAFADEFVSGYKERGQIWTHDRHVSILKKFREYAGDPLPFGRLTPAMLRRYESHLARHYGNSVNTIATNLSAIKTVVRRAIAEGLMEHGANPFHVHTIRTEPTERVRLSLEEIRQIELLELSPNSVEGVSRNTFLFQFYSGGARFSDAAFLTWKSVKKEEIVYRAGKTKKFVAVPLIPQAERILALYKPDGKPDPDELVLPLLKEYDLSTPELKKRAIRSQTTQTNRALKLVGGMANLDKSLTTHVARHSFADHCRTMGMSIYDISKALRHSSIKQTERYLAGFDTGNLGDKMRRLFDE